MLNGVDMSNALSVPSLTHLTNLYPSLVGSVIPVITSPSFTVTFWVVGVPQFPLKIARYSSAGVVTVVVFGFVNSPVFGSTS